jgi:hypothetical protein
MLTKTLQTIICAVKWLLHPRKKNMNYCEKIEIIGKNRGRCEMQWILQKNMPVE